MNGLAISDQAFGAVGEVVIDARDRLDAAGLAAEVSMDDTDGGECEIGIHFNRGNDFVDAAFALIGSEEAPLITLAELRDWAHQAIADALEVKG